MFTFLLVPFSFYHVSKYVHSSFSVILEQDSNISRLKLDMLTYISDITGISPITWAVLSNHIMTWFINIKIRILSAYSQESRYRFMCLRFQRSCQSAVQASMCTDINVRDRIYQIRIYSPLTKTRQFAWYTILLRKFLQMTS